MGERETPFRYRLAGLLKVDQWEGRLLGVELRRARQVLEDNQRLHREALARIEQAETEMRGLHQADARIPLERRQLLASYLKEQYEQAQARKDAVAQAERLFEQIMAQRQAKQQKIRALENHEDRERRAHETEQVRAGLRADDDRWLSRRRGER